MNLPMVSICMLTHNHSNYIAEAIEGILNQQINFNVELIICNDASTDNTHKVVLKIIEKYKLLPRLRIHYFNHIKNLGMIPNFKFALSKCKGKYFALCEGDDYWTDPLKLQKQVDFMESHPQFSGIGTQCELIYENSSKPPHLFSSNVKDFLTINDFLGTRPFHTATFLFNSLYYKNDFPLNILSADRTLFMLIASFGKVKFLSDVTAVYRKNEGGISRNVTSKQMKKDYNIISFIKNYSQNFNIYKLKAFIGYTVLAYSHKIYIHDFLKGTFNYLFYGYLSDRKESIKNHKERLKKRLKLIKKAIKKI